MCACTPLGRLCVFWGSSRKWPLRKGHQKDTLAIWGLAVKTGQQEVVHCLLAASADTDKVANNLHTPLHDAAEAGNEAIVHCLLGRGAETDKADLNDQTALHAAALEGHQRGVRCLLAASVDKDKADSNGRTPCKLHQDWGMRASSADKDKWDDNGHTPLTLYVAVRAGHQAIVHCLVGTAPNNNIADSNGGTPLHVATELGQLGVVQRLLEAHVDTDKADINGRSLWGALHCLLEASTDKEKARENRRTPLHVAAQ